MYVCRHTMAPTSYGQPHLLYSHKGIAPYQHTFKDRKEPALPLQHKQKCRRTPPKLGRVRRHSTYSIHGRRVAYAAHVLRSGGIQGRFATHFLRADAGNPPSQSSGTLRAHPEGAASPHHTGAEILTRTCHIYLIADNVPISNTSYICTRYSINQL